MVERQVGMEMKCDPGIGNRSGAEEGLGQKVEKV
jgi:hypothetical protein